MFSPNYQRKIMTKDKLTVRIRRNDSVGILNNDLFVPVFTFFIAKRALLGSYSRTRGLRQQLAHSICLASIHYPLSRREAPESFGQIDFEVPTRLWLNYVDSDKFPTIVS
jgi:hypothetical protein